VRPGDGSEFVGSSDPYESGEFADVALVRTASPGVSRVGQPLEDGRDVRELLKLERSKHTGRLGRQGGCGFFFRCFHTCILLLIMYFIKSKGRRHMRSNAEIRGKKHAGLLREC